AGCDIQAAKIETWIELGFMVIELVALAIAAAFTFGAASAGAAPVVLATRFAISQIFKRLLHKILTRALSQGAREAAERMAKAATRRGLSRIALRSGRHAGMEGIEELGTEYGVQSYQVSSGRRDGYDAAALGTSLVAGAVGGALGGLA